MIPGQAQQFFEAAAAQSGDDVFKVDRSLRFNDADSAYLNRTPSSATNRRTFTFSAWVKAPDVANTQQIIFSASSGSTPYTSIDFRDNNLRIIEWDGSSVTFQVKTNALLRDVSAWYHFVFAVDTTQSTAADRVKIYVNGVQETSFATADYPSSSHQTHINDNVLHYIGDNAASSYNAFLDAYLAEVNFIDGQALAPTEFGAFDSDNNWNPKDTSGLTFGTNGFHLKFADNSSNAALGTDSSGNNNDWTVNNLVATAPGLSTTNQGFDVVTYSGTGSAQSITDLNFQPDLVWIKVRNQGSSSRLFDSVRGATKHISSNTVDSQNTAAPSLTSFDSNGFSLGVNNDGQTNVNQSGGNYVAWCWKAGGTASSNTDGTETTSVSANTTYGFSVVTYTGTSSADTFGHGLGAVPRMIFFKALNAGTNWQVYHDDGTNKRIFEGLNTNATGSTTINSMSSMPSSTLLSLAGGGYSINSSGTNMVAYCWSEISGFSKFGTYTGDSPGGVTNTVTITGVGFKPKFILIKRVGNGSDGDTAYGGWGMYTLTTTSQLMANCSGAEGIRGNCSGSSNIRTSVSFNDDGFSVSTPWYELNDDNVVYIYAAFASQPDDSIIDSLIDTPTNYEADSGNNGGNYATLNPLNKHNSSDTISNGNLESSWSGGSACLQPSTLGFSSGKYFYEFSPGISGSIGNGVVGIRRADSRNYDNDYSYLGNGQKLQNGSASSYGASYTDGDIIGVAVDMDAGTIRFYKNGADQGQAFSGISGTYTFYQGTYGGSSAGGYAVNFGQRPFAYTPPSGYKSLCTQNLADPTIADGSTAMDMALWTANGSNQTITGFNFSPDFVWAKCRSTGTTPHLWADVVRGASQILYSHSSDTEQDYSGIGGVISSFNSDGFDTGSNSDIATNSRTFVGWAWDGGTSTVSNSDGNVTSQVRANASSGFSIVTWTGTANATVGHGLNAAPQLVITKSRDNSVSWRIWSAEFSNATANYLGFDNAAVGTFGGTYWGSMTSTTFGLGAGTYDNNVGSMVAYCFAPVEGFSAFGSYTGNGSSDGPFVYTGFRPSWIMHKRTDTGGANVGDWRIWDVKRDIDNAAEEILFPNTSGAGSSNAAHAVDILSNGFKFRTSDSNINPSGGTIIYAAFAEHPLKTARAR